MIYRYSVNLPLVYNYTELYVKKASSEFRVELEKDMKWECISESEIKEANQLSKTFAECCTIRIANVWTDDRQMPEPYFQCCVEGILAESQEYAFGMIVDKIDKLCKHFTLTVNRHNCNRHLYQPRIEADWNKACWKEEEYKPYIDYCKQLEANSETFHIYDRIRITDSLFMTSCVKIKDEALNYKSWLKDQGKIDEFLIDEYYIALGQENPKSKFFHLFTIIEYVEHKYEDKNDSKRLCSDAEKTQIANTMESSLKKMEIRKEVRDKICGQISDTLSRLSDIGRAQKLLNILRWMGISEIHINGNSIEIDRKFLQKQINLRNKTFHGERNDVKQYIHASQQLLYLCEEILSRIELNCTVDRT